MRRVLITVGMVLGAIAVFGSVLLGMAWINSVNPNYLLIILGMFWLAPALVFLFPGLGI